METEKTTHKPEIKMLLEEQEWIKISEQGFWVRGVKIEQDPKEAMQVYEAFKEFLVWSTLTKN